MKGAFIKIAKAIGVLYVFGGFLFLIFGLCFIDGSSIGETIGICTTWLAVFGSLINNGERVARWSLDLSK